MPAIGVKLALLMVPLLAGGGALLAMGGKKKKSGDKAPVHDDDSPGASGAGYIVFDCPKCPSGSAFAVDPKYKTALWNALPNWMVAGQDTDNGVVVYTLVPKAPDMPPMMSMHGIINAAKADGSTVLLDPRLAFPFDGQRLVATVPAMLDPWPMTSVELALYYGAGPWATPPGEIHSVKQADPLDELPASLQLSVRSVADKGPIRAQRDLADSLDDDGYHASAEWLRRKAQERHATRRGEAAKNGGYAYVLRLGELPPFMWTERYLGAGEGPRRRELYGINPGLSDKGGWNAGRKLKIPQTWPDPEEVDGSRLMGVMHGTVAAGTKKPTAGGTVAKPGQELVVQSKWYYGPDGEGPFTYKYNDELPANATGHAWRDQYGTTHPGSPPVAPGGIGGYAPQPGQFDPSSPVAVVGGA